MNLKFFVCKDQGTLTTSSSLDTLACNMFQHVNRSFAMNCLNLITAEFSVGIHCYWCCLPCLCISNG